MRYDQDLVKLGEHIRRVNRNTPSRSLNEKYPLEYRLALISKFVDPQATKEGKE